MLPFPWLGRSTDSAFAQDALAFRVLLEKPSKGASLSSALKKALPAPLQKARVSVDGPVVTVEGEKIKKAIAGTYKKSKTKPAPLQRFLDDIEAWLVKVHGEHPIAAATVSWHPWIGPFGRPTPSADHAAAVASPPWGVLDRLAGRVDNGDGASDTRELVTSTLAYLTDHRALFDRIATSAELQRLFAHAWSTEENGACLRLLALFVDDATLETVASVTPRLADLVRGRGFGAGDLHLVSTIATPSNIAWGVIARGRWFALTEPMKPTLRFDAAKETFVMTEETWGLERADDIPSDGVVAGACFAERYAWLIEDGGAPESPADERFVTMAKRAVRRTLRGTVANYKFTWA